MSACVPLVANERVASISAEGHAWLVVPGDSQQQLRIVDPFDGPSIAAVTVELPRASTLHAWSADDAALLTESGLWRLEQFDRIEVSPPMSLSADSAMCGDPSGGGFALDDGVLWQRRADGQWWTWDSDTDAQNAPRALVGHDGACVGVDEVLWLAGSDGALWRIANDTVTRPVRFATLADAAATEGSIGVVDDEFFWSADVDADVEAQMSWQPWRFSGAVPSALSASDGALWMLSDGRVLRFDGEAWTEVTHDAAGAWTGVIAHANGAWLVSDEQVCNLSFAPMLRIDGIVPFQARPQVEHLISVASSDGATIEVFVDDVAVPLDPGEDAGTYDGLVALPSVGWHSVRVHSDATERTLNLKRLPPTEATWAADIEPLAVEHCTGAECHGGTDVNAPMPLDTIEAWRMHAEDIQTRVVESKTMPPPGVVSVDWGDDQIATINLWLQGDQLP